MSTTAADASGELMAAMVGPNIMASTKSRVSERRMKINDEAGAAAAAAAADDDDPCEDNGTSYTKAQPHIRSGLWTK